MTDKDKKGMATSFERLPDVHAEQHFGQKSIITSAEFANFKAYQHALAFTVAGLADKDMLTEIHRAVKGAIDNGTSFNDFKKTLRPFLIAKGYLAPTLGDDEQVNKELLKSYEKNLNKRLKIIYDTNKATAYAGGQWERLQRTKRTFPYLQYCPSLSTNKRDEHKAYYGIVRHIDDPIWQSIFPPNGFGCKCYVKPLTADEARKIGISTDDDVANLPMPEFDSNFDRLGSLLRLAEDKHGRAFREQLQKELLDNVLVAFSQTVSASEFNQAMNKSLGNRRARALLNKNENIAQQAEQFGLSYEELFAIVAYTDSHGSVQHFLRYFEEFLKSNLNYVRITAKQIQYMAQGLQKLPNYIGEVVRRTNDKEHYFRNLQVGDVFTELAFSSSSIIGEVKDDTFNDRKIRLIIQSKTGKKIDWLSTHPHQREVVFLPNTRFLVTHTQHIENELWIKMTEII